MAVTTVEGLPAPSFGGACRHPLDHLTRLWMRLTSRRIDRRGAAWLVGPYAGVDVVGHDWVHRMATAVGGRLSTGPDHGLLTSFAALRGPDFDPDSVDPRIVDFYEHTSAWRLDLWSEWSAIAWPFGRAVTALFSERLKQLSLPMRPLDVSYGMDSKVIHVHDRDGHVLGTAWLRNMIKTGSTTYSGLYGVALVPGSAQPSVRVVFPLPLGSVQVFLRPSVDSRGGLHLRSPLGRFGEDGAYLVLERSGDILNARRVPLNEHFHVFVDDDGDVRCDHSLRLWNVPAVRLHYRLRRSSDPDGGAARHGQHHATSDRSCQCDLGRADDHHREAGPAPADDVDAHDDEPVRLVDRGHPGHLATARVRDLHPRG